MSKNYKLKIYATFRTLGLISVCVVLFLLWIWLLLVLTDYLSLQCMSFFYFLYSVICKSNIIVSLSCTLTKDVDIVSGRPGFPESQLHYFNINFYEKNGILEKWKREKMILYDKNPTLSTERLWIFEDEHTFCF